MRAKIRPILEECIELGIVRGLEKAHKHTDEPTHAHIWEQIEIEIWSFIDERFDFERNVCDEVVEGFDHLDELTEALEEALYLLNPTDEDMQKKAGVYRVVTALEKLREKNAPDSSPEVTGEVTGEVDREWVGFTKDEIDNMDLPDWSTREEFVWIIEAKLKEKNT